MVGPELIITVGPERVVIPTECRVEGSLFVTVPAVTYDPGPPVPPRPPTIPEIARADAVGFGPDPAEPLCRKLDGKDGGLGNPLDPGSEASQLSQLLIEPLPSTDSRYDPDRHGSGNVDITTVYGGELVNARLRALNCDPWIQHLALHACIRWGVNTPGTNPRIAPHRGGQRALAVLARRH